MGGHKQQLIRLLPVPAQLLLSDDSVCCEELLSQLGGFLLLQLPQLSVARGVNAVKVPELGLVCGGSSRGAAGRGR